MSLIERVARALADEEGYAYDPLPYDRRARAAIEAMREPTIEMVAAANRNNHPRDTETWQTMIDAALNEKTPVQP